MSKIVTLRSPSDGTVIAERSLSTDSAIRNTLENARRAQQSWQDIAITARAQYCLSALDWFESHREEIGREISQQMGRPVRYAAGEITGLQERARYMIHIADQALKDIELECGAEFTRLIRPTSLGTVLVIAPWNYPYLTAVNTIIPALMAGNTVILKHSSQTLLCAERFAQAFDAAGLPAGVFQYLHLDHHQCEELIRQPVINLISFTGSVAGGKAVEKAAAGFFKSVALELGGKDAAYVRADAQLDNAVKNLVEGTFFNGGQSCCGIERVYVHLSCYEKFVDEFVSSAREMVLGHALDPETTLGPMINTNAASHARRQIAQAIAQGAILHIDENEFPPSKVNSNYLAPQVLTDVNHDMAVMREESFAPVVGVLPVDSDEQALRLINDSAYGLTASVWSQDQQAVKELADKINTGTVFMNRCDYLDPELAWVGVKHSGRGCSLSRLAYQHLTRPKSFHFKQLHES